MLFSPLQMRFWFGVRPQGVLHVGAHRAEEYESYQAANFGRVLWVEAQESLIIEIGQKITGSKDQVFRGAAWSVSGEPLTLTITNNSQSSSLFSLKEHLLEYPDVVAVEEQEVLTVRLDELIPSKEYFDFLTLDIQGAELHALKGLGDRLHDVKWVFTEVNQRELYAGIPLVDEVDRYLELFGLRRICTVWNKSGWGDALYSRGPVSSSEHFRFKVGVCVIHFLDLVAELRDSLRRKRKRLRRAIYRFIDKARGL